MEEPFTRYWMVINWNKICECKTIVITYLNQSDASWIKNPELSIGNILIKGIELTLEIGTSDIIVSDDTDKNTIPHTSEETTNVYISGFYGKLGRDIVISLVIFWIFLLAVLCVAYRCRKKIYEMGECIETALVDFVSGIKYKESFLMFLIGLSICVGFGIIADIMKIDVLSKHDTTIFSMSIIIVMILLFYITKSVKL